MNTKRLRTIIPLAVIGVIGVGFATHVGVGTLSAIGWQDISLLCPLGALAPLSATQPRRPRAGLSGGLARARRRTPTGPAPAFCPPTRIPW